MNVSLTPELTQYVQTKVESGLYHSASEVIREGLRLLKEKEQLQAVRLTTLRQELQELTKRIKANSPNVRSPI
jgi:antitoxin ParD1/3/4